MENSTSRIRFFIPVFISLFVIWSILVYARSTGITGRTLLGSTQGCTCHNANPDESVTVTIAGPSELMVNETGAYTVTIQGGPLAAAGTDIATDNGTLSIVDNSLQKLSGELTHTSPKAPNNDAVVFDFEYTAPASAGTAIIAANGNSVNLSGTNSGDAWNFADNFTVTINTASAIANNDPEQPESFMLGQNYPNPFNPSTSIDYQIAKTGKVKLVIFDLLGKKIKTLVDAFQPAGSYKVNFEDRQLESGTYIYDLSVDGKHQAKRMTLLK